MESAEHEEFTEVAARTLSFVVLLRGLVTVEFGEIEAFSPREHRIEGVSDPLTVDTYLTRLHDEWRAREDARIGVYRYVRGEIEALPDESGAVIARRIGDEARARLQTEIAAEGAENEGWNMSTRIDAAGVLVTVAQGQGALSVTSFEPTDYSIVEHDGIRLTFDELGGSYD